MKILIENTDPQIPESSILFDIVESPKYGQIYVYNAKKMINSSNCTFFSLEELNMETIQYVHNGHENFSDYITIDLQFPSSKWNSVPKLNHGKYRFILHFNITPVNDPPYLEISQEDILRVNPGIPKILNTTYFKVIDPDNSLSSLIYFILTPMDSFSYNGRFEVNGSSVTKFTQLEIEQGKVLYIFDKLDIYEDTHLELEFQVYDGIETSQTAILSVMIHPLELKVINNSGLILVHKSSALITPTNLYTVTKLDESNINADYNLIKLPQYGFIQKFHAVNHSWISTDSFTNNQILLGHVQYYHNFDAPIEDEFKVVTVFVFYIETLLNT